MTENRFFDFLLGSHSLKGNHHIRSLPQEIRHKIWLEYAVPTLSYSEIIEKDMIEVLEVKLEQDKSGPLNLPPIANFVIFEQPLVQKLFALSCTKMKLRAMNFFFRKYGKKVFPEENNLYKFWSALFGVISQLQQDFSISGPENNHLAVLQWLKEHDFKFDVCIYTFAIAANDLVTIKWMAENLKLKIHDDELLPSIFRKAPFDAEIAKFFLDTFPDLCQYVEKMTAHAINVDNIKGLLFITSYEGTKDKVFDWQNMMMIACYYGSFDCMDWINKTRQEFTNPMSVCDHRVLTNALASNNHMVLTWLYINRAEFRHEIDEYSQTLGSRV